MTLGLGTRHRMSIHPYGLYPRCAVLVNEMCQDLDVLAVAKSGGIPVGMSSIFATVQGARDWCRSSLRIAYPRSEDDVGCGSLPPLRAGAGPAVP